MKSAIYSGRVFHRRLSPKMHEFVYPETLFCLDLEELETSPDRVLSMCRNRFLRSDHVGEIGTSLIETVRDLVELQLGFRPLGSIQIVTHVRQLRYVMNPVSFYYLRSLDGTRVEAVVAEVHNTPWGETHCYAFKCNEGEPNIFKFQKAFHVSPFMDMDQQYVWRLDQPGEELLVRMENWGCGELKFEAKLQMRRRPLTQSEFNRVIFGSPFLTVAVIIRIYVQAAILWVKGCPYFPHPKKLSKSRVAK